MQIFAATFIVVMTCSRVLIVVDTLFLVIVSVPVMGSYLTVVPLTAPGVAPAPNPEAKLVIKLIFL